MRALIAALATLGTGCLISAPEGASQSWPPVLGGTVEAVVAGDLDANTSTDLVVFLSGTESQNGMYLLKGGVDFDLSSVRAFSRFVPTDWNAPMAAFYSGSGAPQVYVAHSEAKLELTQLSNTLEERAVGVSTLAGGGPTLWTRNVTFPGNMPHASVSNGSSIEHFNGELADPRPIPANNSPTWDGALLATSYASAPDQIVVVATSKQILRATIPTTPGSPWAYTVVRDGAPWAGQTPYDLDGDGREEILGLDVASHKLCVVDPGSATVPVTPSCIQLSTTFPGDEVTLLVGQNLSMMMTPDIFIAQANATETAYTLVEDYMFNGGTDVITSGMTHDVPPGPPHGRTVLVNTGMGAPFFGLTFGTDGTANCAIGPCE
jgi:hypothetical protein